MLHLRVCNKRTNKQTKASFLVHHQCWNFRTERMRELGLKTCRSSPAMHCHMDLASPHTHNQSHGITHKLNRLTHTDKETLLKSPFWTMILDKPNAFFYSFTSFLNCQFLINIIINNSWSITQLSKLVISCWISFFYSEQSLIFFFIANVDMCIQRSLLTFNSYMHIVET